MDVYDLIISTPQEVFTSGPNLASLTNGIEGRRKDHEEDHGRTRDSTITGDSTPGEPFEQL